MSRRRTLAWSTAMRDLSRDRVASSGPSPMFARSLARARELEARRAERRAALEAECQVVDAVLKATSHQAPQRSPPYRDRDSVTTPSDTPATKRSGRD